MNARTALQLASLLLAASGSFAQGTAAAPVSSFAQSGSATAAPGQNPTTPARSRARAHRPEPAASNPAVVVLDPAHGGPDRGASLPGNVAESDATLVFANRLRSVLIAQGFTVVLTRENNTDDISGDARTELSNRAHAGACLLLHASNGGHGVHLYTSSLAPAPSLPGPDDHTILPWDTAQTASLPQSTRLLGALQAALAGARLPLVTGRASVAPIDSLTCPSVALEIAPLAANGTVTNRVDDANYQGRVAEATASALSAWRAQLQAAQAAAAAQAQAGAAAAAQHPASTPAKKDSSANGAPVKPRPKPTLVPDDGSHPPGASSSPRRTAPAISPPTGGPTQ